MKPALLIIACLLTFCCFSQKAIKGTIFVDSTKPVAGVTVEIENTTVSTISDEQGNYVISAGDDAVLIFRMQGYRSQEIQVHGRTIIDVYLQRISLSALSRISQKNRVVKISPPCLLKPMPALY